MCNSDSYYLSSFSKKRGANGVFIWTKSCHVYHDLDFIWADHNGYSLIFDLKLDSLTFRFITIYLNPSVSSRTKKWLKLLNSILPYFTTNTILIGDFNFVEHKIDRSSLKIDDFARNWSSFFFIDNGVDLTDVLRSINDNTHTFHRSNYSARLDRIYTSRLDLNPFTSIKVLPIPRGPRSPLSDHRPISFRIESNPGYPKKQPIWRFNSDFLFHI
jgi:endonuclease/exonuclease/phosphatase family metal-dependent hydrolase